MFRELIIPIKLAIRSIRANVGRTAASLLGIVIGVASVILVLSFGIGVKNYVTDQISSFGTNVISVKIKVPKVAATSTANLNDQVGGTQITTFKLNDAKKIAALPNVGPWYAATTTQQETTYLNKKKQAMIWGETAGVVDEDPNMQIETGRMFTEDEDNALAPVVVLGSSLKVYFFGDNDAIGNSIKIKGQAFKVVGILKSRGAVATLNFDESMYIPIQTVQKKLLGQDYILAGIYQIKDMSKIDATITDVNDLMRRQHNIKKTEDDDFAVQSISEVMDILNKVFFALNALLLGLTSISLVVGGVGIMNVMYVSVTERTFEIGLKKSVGAKNGNILAQFLFEAIFITLLGGIFGLISSFFIIKVGEVVAQNFGLALNFSVSWWAALIGIGFSAATGIIFGYFPARKASQLTPMDALRKE
jgi:putative ABC transport system permease protein